MPQVLYMHGFASSPKSEKVRGIRDVLARYGITLNVPDLNIPSFEKLDFQAIVDYVMSVAGQPAAVAGSSLGALVALEVVRRGIAKPLVLIAPALGVADKWITRIPDGDPVSVFNHARGENAPIHRAFFIRMAAVDSDRVAPPVPVTVVMGAQDESVPYERVTEVWQRWQNSGRLVEGSRFVEVADGDHGLTAHVELLAEEIRRVVTLGD